MTRRTDNALTHLTVGRVGPEPVAGYDAARRTAENRRHWEGADDLGPVSGLTPDTRRTLRSRARYEVQNNCFAAGVVRTHVGDTVGTGARLQMLTDDAAFNRDVEDLWRVWAAATDWALNTRVMCGVGLVVGECFGAFRESKKLDRLGIPVPLDVRLLEPDQVADPWGGAAVQATAAGDDGIECDDEGEVVAYRVLKSHPQDFRFGQSLDATRVDARNMIHWFMPQRPGQLRGVTPLAPALPVFNQLRRFTTATLTAAEVAALLAGVLQLPGAEPPGEDPVPGPGREPGDAIELIRGMLITVPGGGSVTQFKPEHPTTNYDMFVRAKLCEIGRAIDMPYGKVAGNHSEYNYSSGRLDDQAWWKGRDIERQGLEAKAFDPTFYKWCEFAKYVIPALIKYEGRWWALKHRWQYDARPTSDPVKDATGDLLNLSNGSDTLAAIAARDGTTVVELVAQRRREMDLFVENKLPLPPWLAGTAIAPLITDPETREATRAA